MENVTEGAHSITAFDIPHLLSKFLYILPVEIDGYTAASLPSERQTQAGAGGPFICLCSALSSLCLQF